MERRQHPDLAGPKFFPEMDYTVKQLKK
jgi:hypothetical protein